MSTTFFTDSTAVSEKETETATTEKSTTEMQVETVAGSRTELPSDSATSTSSSPHQVLNQPHSLHPPQSLQPPQQPPQIRPTSSQTLASIQTASPLGTPSEVVARSPSPTKIPTPAISLATSTRMVSSALLSWASIIPLTNP
ncbi:hypothetical protein FVEG_15237 [Fusarium verticillioides 7600]|uniref:Uncharacterized protein n=1 Tax=Gibberella moniliformis (strain M3125 / FGSC 7600) TaxID=334819 RepID=W7M0P4_GIBM7|nr:hypothetical protein FVEG_15237 [Fusarium verticillioides 7600]EWG41145.1 hypothetical protein FVEG_15237 [Fusarium verticillioides 7600]